MPHAGQSFGTESWNTTVSTIAAKTVTVLKMSQILYAVNFFIRKAALRSNSNNHHGRHLWWGSTHILGSGLRMRLC